MRPVALTVLALLVSSVAIPSPALADGAVIDLVASEAPLIKELQAIHALNLVNRLFLDRDQMHKLLALLEEQKALLDGVKPVITTRRERAAADLAKLRALLESDRIPDEELARSIRTTEFEILPQVQKAQMSLETIAVRAHELLTSNQRGLVAAYNPCLIPQEDKANPARIGAIEVPQDMVEGLEKVRSLPWIVHVAVRGKLVTKAVGDLKAKAPRLDEEAASRKLHALFERVRAMDDLTWRSTREDVVRQEFGELLMMAGFRKPKGDVQPKIREHLLNTSLIPMLKRRLSAPPASAARVDLGQVATQPVCEGDRCGVSNE